MPLLAGIGPFGVPELLIILLIVVLIFGVGRLPDVGGAIGRSIREFRKETKDDKPTTAATTGDAGEAPRDAVYCADCGAPNARGAKFCAGCGASIGTRVG